LIPAKLGSKPATTYHTGPVGGVAESMPGKTELLHYSVGYWTHVAECLHTTVPISHTRPSPHSLYVATQYA